MKFKNGVPVEVTLLDGQRMNGTLDMNEDKHFIYIRIGKDLKLFHRVKTSRELVTYSEFLCDKFVDAEEVFPI